MASSDSDENPDFLLSILHDESDEGEEKEENQHTSSLALLEIDQHHSLHSINATITIRELRSRGLSFQLWPAASSLVSLLDHNPSLLLSPLQLKQTPLKILELGSGTGLVGIAAAALLRAHVTLTDLPNVLPNLQFNTELNSSVISSCGGFISVQQLRSVDRLITLSILHSFVLLNFPLSNQTDLQTFLQYISLFKINCSIILTVHFKRTDR